MCMFAKLQDEGYICYHSAVRLYLTNREAHMKKSLVTLSALLGLVLTGWSADQTWKTSVASGLYSEPDNWTSALPALSDYAYFDMTKATEEYPVYTVTFPESGFTDTSCTRLKGLKDGQSLVFDMTGTTWYKGPGTLTKALHPISLCAGGTNNDFLRLHNNKSAKDNAVFLMSNALLTCSYSATDGSIVDFRKGSWNWYDPNDQTTPASFNLHIGREDTNVVFKVRDGASLRGNVLQLFGGRAEIEGGEHFFAGSLNVGGNAANYGDREVDLNVADARLTLSDHFKIGTAEGQVRATARLSGTVTIEAPTKGTYVQAVKNANAFLEMSDQACITNNELRVGSPADSAMPGRGEMTMTDDAEVYTESCRVGAGSSSGSYGSLTMGGSSRMLVDAPVNYALYVGMGENSTGVVTVAGNASLTVPKDRWVSCPGHAKAYGEINLCENGRASIGKLYLGWPGRYAFNLSGYSQADISAFNASWSTGGEGTVTVGSSAVLNVGGVAGLGVHGPTTVVVKESGRMNVASSVELGKNADGYGEIVVQDDATLSVGADLRLGAASTGGRVSLTVRDRATFTNGHEGYTQGPDTAIVLAGGSFSSTTAAGYKLDIYGSEGPTNGLLVTGGDHALVYADGVRVVSAAAATAATVGRVDLLGGRVKVKQMFGGAGSTAGGGKGKAVLRAAGGTLVPSVTDVTFLEKFDVATLGPGGLTVDVENGMSASVAQAFTDETAGEGLIVKTGEGTLMATANSAHGVTRIEGGTVAFGAGVTEFGKKLVLAGGTYTVDGEFPFEALQLGDAGSVGTLVLATPGKLPITDAAKFAVSNGVIRFTASPALGDYAFIELTGDVDRTMFDRLVILDPDGSNRYGFTFDAEGGTTTVTLKVVDVSSITDVTWAGTESGAWATDANWIGDSKATALNNAVFPAEAMTKQVAVDRNEAADQLKFTGGEYAVSGEGQLTTYGMLVTNGATATVSAPVVPKGSFTLDVAEDAVLDFASPFVRLSAGELVKKGMGSLALTGSRAINTLDWNLRGGRTTVTNDAAIGGSAAGVIVGACTLGFPEGGTYVHDVALDAGSTDQFSVMDVAQDTVISGALNSVSGAFIKRGTGTLEVDYPAGSYVASVGQGAFDRNIAPNVAKWSVPLVFPENGESPVISTDGGANNVGLGGFNVAEGLVRLKGDSATTLAQTNWTVVGVNYPEQAAEAELEISGLTFDNSTASARANFRRFVIGQRTDKDVPFRHPTLRVIDGATLKAQGIWLGTAYDVDTYPTLAVTNATVTVDSQFYVNLGDGNNQKCHPVIRVGPGGAIGFTASAQQDWRYTLCVGMFTDCDVDGGSITIPSGLPGGVLIGHTACGCLAFRNGGTFEFPMLQTRDNKNGEKKMTDLVFAFDNGVMKLNRKGESIISAPSTRYVQIEDGGLTVEVGDGLMHTMRLPFRGTGALTKTGAGTFVLGVGKENLYGAYPSSGTPTNTVDSGLTTAAYAGKTTVAEGTLVFEEGELVATKVVEVSAGATLELSNAETAYGFETLSGAGTIQNGMIGRCAIACDGTSALTFDNVTLGAVTVDFGHDETDPIDLATLAGLKVAQLDNGSTATKWKIAGTGHKNVRGTFVIQPDGSVILTEVRMTGLLMIVR